MDPKTNFRLILYQTELERFKFLVRSFLRARIAKVSIARTTPPCRGSHWSPDGGWDVGWRQALTL